MFANKLSDLDDFLPPSLECIKPLSNANFNAIDLAKPRPDLIKPNADKIAKVTL